MSPSKREREYARRRYARYQQQLVAARAKRRKQRTVAAAILGVLVLVLGVTLAAQGLSGRNSTSSAASSPAANATPSQATTPSATYKLAAPSTAQNRSWTGKITTNVGVIGIQLDGAAAPQAVASFVNLAQKGNFNNTKCHRLVTKGIFVLQCGDPTGTGSGGPGYTFGPVENSPTSNVYPAGTIAMARQADKGDSMGSQFFLVYKDSTIPADSAGGYTIFGRMTSGLDVVTAVADAGVQGGKTDGLPATGVTIQGVETQ